MFVPAAASALPKDSVVNVSQPMTVDRTQLEATEDALPAYVIDEIEVGLRRVLAF